MTPQVPDLLRELAIAVELYVKHAAAAQTAAAERDRVSDLLREAAPELFGSVALPEPKPTIVAPAPIGRTVAAKAKPKAKPKARSAAGSHPRVLDPMSEPPPGKLSKRSYIRRLGLKDSNVLSSHTEVLASAVDADGWLDVAEADAILLRKTKEDSGLGRALRAVLRQQEAKPEPVLESEQAPQEAPTAPAPKPTLVVQQPQDDPLAPPPVLTVSSWPTSLMPETELARNACEAANFIRRRYGLRVIPADRGNLEGNWLIGSRTVTAEGLIQEAVDRKFRVPEPAA